MKCKPSDWCLFRAYIKLHWKLKKNPSTSVADFVLSLANALSIVNRRPLRYACLSCIAPLTVIIRPNENILLNFAFVIYHTSIKPHLSLKNFKYDAIYETCSYFNDLNKKKLLIPVSLLRNIHVFLYKNNL